MNKNLLGGLLCMTVLLFGCAESDSKETTTGDKKEVAPQTEASSTVSGVNELKFFMAANEKNVYTSESDKDLCVEVSNSSFSFEEVKVIIKNLSSSELTYGEHYSIWMLDGEKNKCIIPRSMYAFLDVEYKLNPGEEVKKSFSLNGFDKSDFEPGEYVFRIEGLNFVADDKTVQYEEYSETIPQNIFDVDLHFTVE